MRFQSTNLKGKGHLEDLSVNASKVFEKVLQKLILKEWVNGGLL
jgi:hypothetical protein